MLLRSDRRRSGHSPTCDRNGRDGGHRSVHRSRPRRSPRVRDLRWWSRTDARSGPKSRSACHRRWARGPTSGAVGAFSAENDFHALRPRSGGGDIVFGQQVGCNTTFAPVIRRRNNRLQPSRIAGAQGSQQAGCGRKAHPEPIRQPCDQSTLFPGRGQAFIFPPPLAARHPPHHEVDDVPCRCPPHGRRIARPWWRFRATVGPPARRHPTQPAVMSPRGSVPATM